MREVSAKSAPDSLVRITLPPKGGIVKSLKGYFQTSWFICCSARKKAPGVGIGPEQKVHGGFGITKTPSAET